jgi:mRNA-degrading endonuclease toxin of MazEF toxin-antitoxin module
MHQYRRSSRAPRKDTGSVPVRGEVWWASRVDGIKDRPVVILSFSDPKVTFRSCTSKDSAVQSRELIEDYDIAGLDRPTYLSPTIKEMDRARLVRRIGSLSQYDRAMFHI